MSATAHIPVNTDLGAGVLKRSAQNQFERENMADIIIIDQRQNYVSFRKACTIQAVRPCTPLSIGQDP
ncbi:hypothetical protein GGR95_000107 [Sulfitobacter undariae]|uniref:Uncharacterized protein n=1 Tax=Sulfitobacter undariae TaxID=1563671 RepID=A0A7W6E662_9RHOB|nr:hypothetical protein [Sulfitobacter undariae]